MKKDYWELFVEIAHFLCRKVEAAQNKLDSAIDNGYDTSDALNSYADARKMFGLWDDINKDALGDYLMQEAGHAVDEV